MRREVAHFFVPTGFLNQLQAVPFPTTNIKRQRGINTVPLRRWRGRRRRRRRWWRYDPKARANPSLVCGVLPHSLYHDQEAKWAGQCIDPARARQRQRLSPTPLSTAFLLLSGH